MARVVHGLVILLGGGLALFHFSQAFFIALSSTHLFIVHALGTILLVCLVSIAERLGTAADSPSRRRWYMVALVIFVAILGAGSLGYAWAQAERLEIQWPFITNVDVVIGFLLIFVVTIVTWLSWGLTLSLVGVIGALYFLFGHLLPGLLGHSGASLPYALSYLGMNLQTGLFWLIPVSAFTIFPLVVFGMLIQSTRSVEAFIELIKAASRKLKIQKVGPILSSVIGSGIAGTVTGGAVPNVAIVGSSTIPAMIRLGLKPELAAGVEALASTGAQIVPPVMGLSAFLMAQLIGVPYVSVMIAAVLPAILYYVGTAISVYFMGMNESISEDKDKDKIEWSKVYRLLPIFLVSLGVLIVLLIRGFSELYAATWASIAVVILSQMQGRYRPSLLTIAKGLRNGAVLASQIAVVIMSIGLLGQALITTGLGMRLSRIFLVLAGDNLISATVVLAIATLILGIGAPVVVAYILAAIVIVPGAQDLGLDLLPAHFFAFYFAVFAPITPPVAEAVLTASRIAQSKFWPTSWQAMKLSWALYLVPFAFAFHPDLLRFPKMPFNMGIWIVLLVFLCTTIDGAASMWNGVPGFRLGIVSRGTLLLAAISGIGYIFSSHNAYLITLLVASAVGWGMAFLQRQIPANTSRGRRGRATAGSGPP